MVVPRFQFKTYIAAVSSGIFVWGLAAISMAQDLSVSSTVDEYDPYERVSEESLESAFRSLKRNDSLQFELPEAPEPPRLGWLEKLADVIAAFFKFVAPLLQIIFWVGLGALIVGIIYIIAQTIYSAYQAGQRKEKTVKVTAPAPLYQPEEQKAKILLEEIDALAAQGRFDEAVHTLLHRSIQDIDANRPNVIRRSLTSREISCLSVLTETAQTAFSSIAQIVEHSYFGGHVIGRREFESARDAYSVLTSNPSEQAVAA